MKYEILRRVPRFQNLYSTFFDPKEGQRTPIIGDEMFVIQDISLVKNPVGCFGYFKSTFKTTLTPYILIF